MAVEAKKWVYPFNEGDASQIDLLGGKGAGLAEMTQMGIRVPPGFTITTEACRQYYSEVRIPSDIWDQTLEALDILEKKTGKKLGNATNPLLVSVRSGAKSSMPGMMDTVLNLGLNDQSVEGLMQVTDNPRFVFDTYRRFVQMFGSTVLGVSKERFDEAFEGIKREQGALKDTDLNAQALKTIVTQFKAIVREGTGKEFPQEPHIQLYRAVGAVFDSWYGKRAQAYRKENHIPDDLGTAVNVVQMVFGNMGEDSGTGVAFTRNPATGERKLYGEYLRNAQGEDVVAGVRTPEPISALAESFPAVFEQLKEITDLLEGRNKDAQDVEFTIEKGVLYMLQTRTGKRSAEAAVRIATDMVEEDLISVREAIGRVTPQQVEQLLSAVFDADEKKQALTEGRLLTKGIDASPGAAVGEVVFDAKRAEERAKELKDGEKVILVRRETSAEDYSGMLVSGGILTARGGRTSHAAVVARGASIPAVVGASDLEIDLKDKSMKINGITVREGDTISFDGSTGEVISGAIRTIERAGLSESPELSELLSWADNIAQLEVWANADNPKDARRAREYGAQGIGLCRTEHMFSEKDRMPVFQRMIMAAQDAKRHQDLQRALASGAKGISQDDLKPLEKRRREYEDSLAQLLPIQQEDFRGILEEMDGLPVIIRLLDAPLHEFLPNHTDLAVEIAVARESRVPETELSPKVEQLVMVEKLKEQEPMMGLRAVRLGIMYPEIFEMQVQAIIQAAAELKKSGRDPHPKIMVPLVSYASELKIVRERLEAVARGAMTKQGVKVNYQFGVMIETPRAALTADQIAEVAEFFSFGSNDLTQGTAMFSRDDADKSFLPEYKKQGIVPTNPFQSIDTRGVGKLIKMAVTDGRAVKPGLSIGVCGEHGGDPASIAFFEEAGLNYVSASPNRVPVARLAAAQAQIKKNLSSSGPTVLFPAN